MENTLYLALSRQSVLQNNMDIIANNVANMNTVGFRGQNLIFKEYISDPKGEDDPLSFVYDEGQYQDTRSGPVTQTGNQLDVALNGPGFMSVTGPGGKTAYTRAGDFQIGPNGELVTSAGFAVNGQSGPIVIPAGSTEVKIDEKGVISNQNGAIGQLQISEFDNVQKLDPMGNDLYTTNATPIPAENTRVMQGALEGSNINPILEMTRMIQTSRAFQGVQHLIENESDLMRTAIQKLTQQG